MLPSEGFDGLQRPGFMVCEPNACDLAALEQRVRELEIHLVGGVEGKERRVGAALSGSQNTWVFDGQHGDRVPAREGPGVRFGAA